MHHSLKRCQTAVYMNSMSQNIPFVSPIEFIRFDLSNRSAHVAGPLTTLVGNGACPPLTGCPAAVYIFSAHLTRPARGSEGNALGPPGGSDRRAAAAAAPATAVRRVFHTTRRSKLIRPAAVQPTRQQTAAEAGSAQLSGGTATPVDNHCCDSGAEIGHDS